MSVNISSVHPSFLGFEQRTLWQETSCSGKLLLPAATKLGQGNIFIGVCQDFCSQGGGCLVPGGSPIFRGGCLQFFGGSPIFWGGLQIFFSSFFFQFFFPPKKILLGCTPPPETVNAQPVRILLEMHSCFTFGCSEPLFFFFVFFFTSISCTYFFLFTELFFVVSFKFAHPRSSWTRFTKKLICYLLRNYVAHNIIKTSIPVHLWPIVFPSDGKCYWKILTSVFICHINLCTVYNLPPLILLFRSEVNNYN